MITVQEATRIVLDNTLALGDERLLFHRSAGRVLREDLHADRDFPPFDRVAMDGIAFSFKAFEQGQRIFSVEGLQAAGAPRQVLQKENNCLEVMTGATLPQNTDTVVRYEDLELQNRQAKVLIESVKAGQNIHRQGSDRREGEMVVQAGCNISPAEIGVAATLGKTDLLVARLPKVAIISTGDELVDVHQTPLPHQIRKSNAHTLAAAAAQWGIEAELLHLRDNRLEIEAFLRGSLQKYDVLLLSGGVSEGKLDFLPEVLANLGVQKLFHKVSQRPGKPFWFGRVPDGAVVLAFPGNPVSSFMCLHRYFKPWLRAGLGLEPFDSQYAALAEDFDFSPGLTYFLQVKVNYGKDCRCLATPVAGGGSGDLANLVDADAFLELPLEKQEFKKGEVYPLIPYR